MAVATAWVLQAVQPLWAQYPPRKEPAPAPIVAVKRDLPAELPFNVEIAWLGDAGLFHCGLAARITGEGLELTGFVGNESLRRKAVEMAQVVAKTPVVDHLKVIEGMPLGALTGGRSTEIAPAATQMLSESLGDRVTGLQVSSPEPGAIEIAGSIASAEDKLAVSKCLKGLRGCTHVINRAEAPESPGETTVVKVTPKAPPMPVSTNTVQPYSPPAVSMEDMVSRPPLFPRLNRMVHGSKRSAEVAQTPAKSEAGPSLPVEAAPARRSVSAPESGAIVAQKPDRELTPSIREPLVAQARGPAMTPPPAVEVKPAEPIVAPAPPAVAKAPRVEFRPMKAPEPVVVSSPAATVLEMPKVEPAMPKVEKPVEIILIPTPAMPEPEKPMPAEPVQTAAVPDMPKLETPKLDMPKVEEAKAEEPKPAAPAPVEVVKAPAPSVEISLPTAMPMMPEMPKVAEPAPAVAPETTGFAETHASVAKAPTVEMVKPAVETPAIGAAEMPKPIEPVIAAVPMPAPAPPMEAKAPASEAVKPPVAQPARSPKSERFTMKPKAAQPEPATMAQAEPKPLPSLEPTVKFGGDRTSSREGAAAGEPIVGMVRVPSRGTAAADIHRARAAMDDLCRGQCRDLEINASADRLTVQMKVGAGGDWDGLLSKLRRVPELAGYSIVYSVTVDGRRAEPAIRSVSATSNPEPAAPAAPMMGIMRMPAGTGALPDADTVRKAVESVCRGAGDDLAVRATGTRQIAISMSVRQASEWNAVYARIKQMREIAGYSVIFNVQVKG